MIWPQLGVLWMRMGLRHGHVWVSNVDTSGHIVVTDGRKMWKYMDMCHGQTWASNVDISGRIVGECGVALWRYVESYCGWCWTQVVENGGGALWIRVGILSWTSRLLRGGPKLW